MPQPPTPSIALPHPREFAASAGSLSLAVFVLAASLLAAPAARAQEGHEGHAGHGEPEDHSAHQAMLAGGGEDREARPAGGLDIPNVLLLDQEGREVDFYRDLVQGKVVAMNFVFTTCTTICPPMGATFAKVQRELGERAGRDAHLISVSVDPNTDTPERMKAWGQRFGAGEGWTLVTGSKADVDRLLKALEVFTPDFTEHSPTVLVGNDRSGHWMRAYGLAPPAKITGLIEEMAAEGRAGSEGHAADGRGHAGHGGP